MMLLDSPFAQIGATPRDDRRRIVQLAEEAALHHDPDICQAARVQLTHPRNRLAAELAWLPGLSPRRAAAAVTILRSDPGGIIRQQQVGGIAYANLLASALPMLPRSSAALVGDALRELATHVEELSLDAVIRDINEDRAVAKFPMVSDSAVVAEELLVRRRFFVKQMLAALDDLPTDEMIQCLTEVLEFATESGSEAAPSLLDELTDEYEVRVGSSLQSSAEKIHAAINQIAAVAAGGGRHETLKAVITELGSMVREWDGVAQPIQLSMQSRGTTHGPSRDLAMAVRGLAVDLFNQHDYLEEATSLSELLSEVFAEVPVVAERVEEDLEALEEIKLSRNTRAQKAEEERARFRREITYETTFGLVFKDILRLDEDGVTWKGTRYAYEDITHTRWGGFSSNGSVSFVIGFGTATSEAIIQLSDRVRFQAITSRLWRATIDHILRRFVQNIQAGYSVPVGDALICDDGIGLPERKLFGKGNPLRVLWADLSTNLANGILHLRSAKNPKLMADLNLLSIPNAHAVRMLVDLMQENGEQRLTQFLGVEDATA